MRRKTPTRSIVLHLARILAVAAVVMLSPRDALAAINSYLTVSSSSQGTIKGGVKAKGHEETIRVLRISHKIVSPRDAASGLPTGKRQHKPMVLELSVDRAMPALMDAMIRSERLDDVRLQVFAKAGKKETAAYEITLENARITGIELATRTAKDGKTEDILVVSFTYQKIIWLWNNGGIMAEDDWETPVAKSKSKSKSKAKKSTGKKKPVAKKK